MRNVLAGCQVMWSYSVNRNVSMYFLPQLKILTMEKVALVGYWPDPSRIPVAHFGGQQRPLATSAWWEPSSEEEQQELGDIIYTESRPSLSELGSVRLVPQSALYSASRAVTVSRRQLHHLDELLWSQRHLLDHPSLLRATPKAKPADSHVLKASSKGAPKPKPRPQPAISAAASSSSGSGPSGSNHPWNSQFAPRGTDRPTEVVDLTTLELEIVEVHLSVKAFLWSPDQHSLVRVEGELPKLQGSAIVYDWHQVLDTDHISKWRTEWVDDSGTVPHRHQGILLAVSHLCQPSERPVSIVICSHIEKSSGNLDRLIYVLEQSRLPVSLVLVIDNRTGERGKYQTLKLVVKGNFCVFDDNHQIIEDFHQESRVFFQVLKNRPQRSRLLREDCVGWSISSEPLLSRAKNFVRHVSRQSV
eukprot:s552_g20.t1